MKKLAPVVIAALALSVWTARAGDVAELYEKNCVKCHGADGKGDTKMGKKIGLKDLSDAKVQSEFTDEKAFKIIKEGLKEGDKTLMKPSEGLSDADIKALVKLTRSFKK
jgi:mono/diheme cytochrome c family protein